MVCTLLNCSGLDEICSSELDIVLVKADSKEEIRMAFKNYFSDAKDFPSLLTEVK